MDIVGFIKDHVVILSIIAGLLLIFLYVIYAVFLNKLNKALYGKTTIMAWLPIFNTYLLGKVTINRLYGWILILGSIVGVRVTSVINGVEKEYSILPKNIQEPYAIIYAGITLITIIGAVFKLKKLTRSGKAKSEFDQFSKSNFSNLNRPFVDKNTTVSKYIQMNNAIEEENKKQNTLNMGDNKGFYDTMETPKISLSSLNHHSDTNDKQEPKNP